LDEDDVAAVVEALRSPYLTTGPRVGAFEDALARTVGAEHAVAVSSGTAALHAACHVLDLGPEDEVVVPAITFLATANAVRYVGARVVFADVCPDCGLMRPEDLERAMTPRTRAVMPVDLTGRPTDLEAIAALARDRGAAVVEDAAHALGATLRGRTVGDGTWADMAIFSFHPVKHVTTGEGGAVVTNDPERAARLRRFASHGMVRDASALEHPSPGPWYYEQQELGFNYRLTDVQCALGISQLAKLGRFVERRRALAARYDRLLADLPSVEPVDPGPDGSESAYHLYAVLVDFEGIGRSRAQVVQALRERGIGTQVHYIPVPSQPDYERLGHDAAAFPGALRYYERTLSLPLFPRMEDADVDRVVGALADVLRPSAGLR
ncbi:MAG: UDP-4-amino-4,6-dideoxy-N-acetyl-beta-L-altrosamine transaminase, partial [Planctomycetota bacterium]